MQRFSKENLRIPIAKSPHFDFDDTGISPESAHIIHIFCPGKTIVGRTSEETVSPICFDVEFWILMAEIGYFDVLLKSDDMNCFRIIRTSRSK